MPIKQDLLDQIKSALRSAIKPSLTTASNVWDLYEGYIFSLVVEAARNEQARVSFYDVTGARVTTTFIFRTSPGSIGMTTPAYCHAEIRFLGKPTLEAHISVYIRGRSTVKHENDVAVVRKDEAQACRAQDRHPKHSKLILLTECKMYQSSPLGIGLGRGFIGLTVDLRGAKCMFVGNKQSLNIERLLANHRKVRVLEVVPANPARESQLRGLFQAAFQDFKAKN